MKRRARMIVLFLLMGAIINVAVAWGAYFTPQTQALSDLRRIFPPTPVTNEDETLWNRHATRAWPNSGRLVVNQHRLFMDLKCIEISSKGTSRYTAHATEEEMIGLGDFYVGLIRCGYPMRCLSWEQWEGVPQYAGFAKTAGDDGFSVGDRAIPRMPIWPGFAINTIFYAAILWLSVAGLGALRRRRRIKRGLCSRCGYPVSASEGAVCSECGTAVSPR